MTSTGQPLVADHTTMGASSETGTVLTRALGTLAVVNAGQRDTLLPGGYRDLLTRGSNAMSPASRSVTRVAIVTGALAML